MLCGVVLQQVAHCLQLQQQLAAHEAAGQVLQSGSKLGEPAMVLTAIQVAVACTLLRVLTSLSVAKNGGMPVQLRPSGYCHVVAYECYCSSMTDWLLACGALAWNRFRVCETTSSQEAKAFRFVAIFCSMMLSTMTWSFTPSRSLSRGYTCTVHSMLCGSS